jgi:TolB-like protein/Tfp pilus assembly protein PilF
MLERIVQRALHKDPDKRYASANELLTDLRALEEAESEASLKTTTMGAAPGRRRWLTVAAPIAGAVLLAVVALLLWQAQKAPPSEPTEQGPKRIVVLPFENLGPPEDEYFADGMTEEIISRLAAVSGLEVISRTSAMNYKGTDKNVRQIGEELEVHYALEGTVRWDRSGRDGGRARITPQLIRVDNDAHLWSERYDRVIEDIFSVQSDIAERVVGQLEVTLLEREQEALDERPTDNMEAYHAYLRGRYHHTGGLREEIERAIEMYQRAVELDPEFGLAHAMMSIVHSSIFYRGWDPTEERAALAKRSADRALEIDPDHPMAQVALGWYYDRCLGDADRALEEFGRVAAARPNDYLVHLYIAFSHARQGHFTEAVAGLERSLELDPQGYAVLRNLANNYSRVRRHREAAETIDRAIAVAPERTAAYRNKFYIHWSWHGPSPQSRKTLEETPESAPWLEQEWVAQETGERNYEAALERLGRIGRTASDTWPASLSECFCYSLMNRPREAQQACDEARALLEEGVTEQPDNSFLHSALAIAYANLGRTEEAVRVGEQAVAMHPVGTSATGRLFRTMYLVWIYVWVGEQDAALDRVEYLLSTPGPLTVSQLRLHPFYDPLRDHPRFQEILEKYGGEDAAVQ